MEYSTNSDSTIFYYEKGWHEIMDLGDYSGAEISYRKALEFDSDFLVGKSVLARLTTDLEERTALYEGIGKKMRKIEGDERLVLEVYMALVNYTNLRDKKAEGVELARKRAYEVSESNLGQVVHNNPSELYLKCEYIEVIHSLYGAQASLDSMESLVLEDQKSNPFLIGYAAILNAELGNFDIALENAKRLKEHYQEMPVAKPHAILADIYYKMHNYEEALVNANRSFEIDPNNLDGSRLKTKIETRIAELLED